MVDIIIATDKNNGIGYKNNLPWDCKEELQIFKKKTMNNVLIVGRKTLETLPLLKNRIIFCVSKTLFNKSLANEYIVFSSIEEACFNAKKNYPLLTTFIIGGSEIYNYVFKNMLNSIDKIHLSIFNKIYETDSSITFDKNQFIIDTEDKYEEFNHYVLTKNTTDETHYLQLLKNVLTTGSNRTETRNGNTKSLTAKSLEFDLSKGFPILTTKKIYFKGVIEELLFFLRGDTDTTLLEEKNVNIWKPNTTQEFIDSQNLPYKKGMMGPLYGFQFRNFNAKYNKETGKSLTKGVDQLSYIVNTIRTNPQSRRILMTSYNPEQAFDCVLFPCHSIVLQFFVDNGILSMACYNRSQDLFLGVPFNISSSALLLVLISKITGLQAGKLTIFMGDVHIYEQHFKNVETQLNRLCYKFPLLEISKELKEISDIEKLEFEDFKLIDYKSHPLIKAEMVA